MSSLVLIRHGQAMPFQDAPDRLSVAGEAQARKLGAFWTLRRVVFDEVYTGTLARQARTAEIVAECYAQAGIPWPRPQVFPGLDEYDAEGILAAGIPRLSARDEGFQALVEEIDRAAARAERDRRFQRVFEAVMREWQDGTVAVLGLEPWSAFRDRVAAAMTKITGSGRSGRRVAAFTSGGPIGVTVQRVLQAPERMALELNWRIRNCSLTEIVFSKDRASLDLFNAAPHLDNPSLETYR
jgi:broad specificity phosphatase PhoE